MTFDLVEGPMRQTGSLLCRFLGMCRVKGCPGHGVGKCVWRELVKVAGCAWTSGM